MDFKNTTGFAGIGASIGTMFLPGIGTGIGALLGAGLGLFADSEANSNKVAAEAIQDNTDLLNLQSGNLDLQNGLLNLQNGRTDLENSILSIQSNKLGLQGQVAQLETQKLELGVQKTQTASDISAYDSFLSAFPNYADLQKNTFEAQSRQEFRGLLNNYAINNVQAGATGRVGGSAGLVAQEAQNELIDFSGSDMELGGGDGGRYQMGRSELYGNLTAQQTQAETQRGILATSLTTLAGIETIINGSIANTNIAFGLMDTQIENINGAIKNTDEAIKKQNEAILTHDTAVKSAQDLVEENTRLATEKAEQEKLKADQEKADRKKKREERRDRGRGYVYEPD